MACFTVPLATAAAVSAAKGALPEGAKANPFVAKLGWLGKMMFGGSFLLAVEHVYHGEIVFTPPFLTAVKNGETAEMLHEMATRGVAMTVLLLVAWVAMVFASRVIGERRSHLGPAAFTTLMAFWGAALMWSVDSAANVLEGGSVLDGWDVPLALLVFGSGLFVYAVLSLYGRLSARAAS